MRQRNRFLYGYQGWRLRKSPATTCRFCSRPEGPSAALGGREVVPSAAGEIEGRYFTLDLRNAVLFSILGNIQKDSALRTNFGKKSQFLFGIHKNCQCGRAIGASGVRGPFLLLHQRQHKARRGEAKQVPGRQRETQQDKARRRDKARSSQAAQRTLLPRRSCNRA